MAAAEIANGVGFAPHVAVVGTGPAGEAAARTLLPAGVTVTLIDEQPRTGGNIARVAWGSPRTALEALIAEWSPARLRAGTAVLGIEPPGRLYLEAGHGVEAHDYDAVILACGAYDLHYPVPGLPASTVSSAGALQALLKGQRLRPRGDIVLAGSGPFLYAVAAGLLAAGANVSHVIDRLHARDYARLGHWGALIPGNAMELAAARLRMLRHGTRLIRGRGVQRVADSHAILDGGRAIGFDHLGFTELFIPQTQLARSAGCRLRYARPGGYWVVESDTAGRSSATGIYVCGEGRGIRGWRHARVTGRLAAAALLRDYGMRAPPVRGLERRRRHLARFGLNLEQAQRRREPTRFDPEAVICPCEGARVRQVAEAVSLGLEDLSSIKVVTRCGMGPCQGRYCEPLVARVIEQHGAEPRSALNQRAFTRPVDAGEVADAL